MSVELNIEHYLVVHSYLNRLLELGITTKYHFD